MERTIVTMRKRSATLVTSTLVMLDGGSGECDGPRRWSVTIVNDECGDVMTLMAVMTMVVMFMMI